MIRGKHEFKVGIDVRANQMNVGAEAFQDGFWIPLGSFSGNAEADLSLGYVSISEHDQTFNGWVTVAAGKSSAPTFKTIGESPKTSPSIWALRGI